MDITCLADLHGFQPELPGGDILILAGDFTASDKLTEWASFFKWLKIQPYKNKILVAGNHDNLFEHGFPKNQFEADDLKDIIDYLDIDIDFEYLCDSGIEIVIKNTTLKIWGAPWTPIFSGVNYRCKAFMDSEEYLDKRFALIPADLDILITHSPPYGILDQVPTDSKINKGSKSLRNSIEKKIPEMVIFGHIHEQGGKYVQKEGILYINGSLVDERYRNVNRARRIIFDEEMPKMQRFKVIE